MNALRALLFCLLLMTCRGELMAAERGSFRTSDGVRLEFLSAGAGPLLVFEPGWMCPAWIWEAQLAYFSHAGWRAVALDPRAQGGSDRPANGFLPERRARDVRELVEHLRPDAPVVLVGWSMGVGEVLSYASQFGTKELRALVLVDGFLGGEPTKEGMVGRLQWLEGLQRDPSAFFDGFMKMFFARPQPPDYLQRLRADIERTPVNSAVLLQVGHLTRNFWGDLAKVDRPVLYVCQRMLEKQAEKVRATLPGAQIEVIDGVGHALFVDAPERFNARVAAFLGRP
ncbi:MAG: alpha/beta hydrolase [Verrucomicrobia bacterium]|jgi:microsomal epoxide hydrolase|nr:alpha/beta hydrolase [Verrucomicrobiota bacterium]